MQPGKSANLCLNQPDYRVMNLTVVGADCNVHPNVSNATYNCTAVNVTDNVSLSDGDASKPRHCEQLLTIECVRMVPLGRRRSCSDDSDDDGGGCDGSDSGAASVDGDDLGNLRDFGDDEEEEELVLCLSLEKKYDASRCNMYVDVSMQDPGKFSI